MRAGSLPLIPLRSLQSVVLLGLILVSTGIALPDRVPSIDSVLAGMLRVVLLLVSCEAQPAAKRLLLRLLHVDGGRLRLV